MKSRHETSFLGTLSTFLPYRESIPLFILTGLGIASGWLINRDTLRNYSHVWLAPVSSLLGTLFLGYFGRCKETRELGYTQELNNEKSLQKEMDLQFKLGEQALKQDEYLLAYDYFTKSLEIFRQIFDKDTRAKSIELKNLCIYNQGLALFGLKRYEEAKRLISEIILPDDLSVLSLSPVQIRLINLRGAIAFIQGCFTNSFTLWSAAKTDFERSYLADSSQNNVYLYLQYLNGKYAYISENIPNEQWQPKIHLNFNQDDVLFDGIMLLCADSCLRQKKWSKAICLYENYLEALQNDSNAFLELFLLNMNCFKAYASMLESSLERKKIQLFRIVQNESGPQLVIEELVSEDVVPKAVHRFEKAKACLEGELFIDKNEATRAEKHLKNVYAYASLFEQSQRLLSLKDQTISLKEEANKHYKEAEKLLDANDLSLKQAEECLRTMETNVDNNKEDRNRCILF